MKNNHLLVGLLLSSNIFNFLLLSTVLFSNKVNSTKDDHINAKRLYNHLMVDYNSYASPSVYGNVNVSIGLKLIHFSLNLKNQILSTNVILEQQWLDSRLSWNKDEFRNLDKLHILAKQIYLPDIVLLNNADANYEIKKTSKLIVNSNGQIEWFPMLNLKSTCNIDIYNYPLDSQNCVLKFGSWTKQFINLQLKYANENTNKLFLNNGIDLSMFESNFEYEILNTPAQLLNKKSRNHNYRSYQEVYFHIKLRRKNLFYTFNLLIPLILINLLTIVVFYLPSYSNRKITLSVTNLILLTIYMLFINESIPTTLCLSVSFINRYIFFTLCQIILSIFLAALIINLTNYPPIKLGWFNKKILLRFLPKLLKINRPNLSILNMNSNYYSNNSSTVNSTARSSFSGFCYPSACQNLTSRYHLKSSQSEIELINSRFHYSNKKDDEKKLNKLHSSLSSKSTTNSTKRSSSTSDSSSISCSSSKESEKQNLVNSNVISTNIDNYLLNDDKQTDTKRPLKFQKAVYNLNFLADRIQNNEKYSKVKQDWQFLVLLLDRLFLWLFSFSCIIGWLYFANTLFLNR